MRQKTTISSMKTIGIRKGRREPPFVVFVVFVVCRFCRFCRLSFCRCLFCLCKLSLSLEFSPKRRKFLRTKKGQTLRSAPAFSFRSVRTFYLYLSQAMLLQIFFATMASITATAVMLTMSRTLLSKSVKWIGLLSPICNGPIISMSSALMAWSIW